MPPLAAEVVGAVSGVGQDVDTNNNAHVNTPLVAANAGFVSCEMEIDHGNITGTRLVANPYVSTQNRLAAGLSTPLLDYNFNGTAQATGQWKCLFTTMTITEGSGYLLFNANSTSTTTTGCALSSWRYLKLEGGGELYRSPESPFPTFCLSLVRSSSSVFSCQPPRPLRRTARTFALRAQVRWASSTTQEPKRLCRSRHRCSRLVQRLRRGPPTILVSTSRPNPRPSGSTKCSSAAYRRLPRTVCHSRRSRCRTRCSNATHRPSPVHRRSSRSCWCMPSKTI